ncbi:CAP domain-containing protein [Candidatus Halobeggiatoa sp. HSG11]|nr:CAP domain-containing protein [Candidatus Halobeggiatoa sp. HSG11]
MKSKLYVAIGLFCYASFVTAVEEDNMPILSSQFDLSIPILYYDSEDTPLFFWAELKFYEVNKDNEILFKVDEYGSIEETSSTKSFDTVLSSQFGLSIPIFYYDSKDTPSYFGAELEFDGLTKGNEILFKVTEYDSVEEPNSTKPSSSDSTDNGSTKPSDSTNAEPEEFTGILEAHNVWRKKVGVPYLKWSSEAAKLAQKWANDLKNNNNCEMKHNPKRGNFGENIYRSKGFNPTTTEVVDAWGNEVADYNYSKNTCKTDKVCGHYTQVVWETTEEVGCGKVNCSGRKQIWVCNYSPPGNVVGKKPY